MINAELLHTHQHRSHSAPEEILSAIGIMELAGDESQPIVGFGLEIGVGVLFSVLF